MSILTGKVWRFGANIDTDVILPGRYLTLSNPEDLAKHCMEDADAEFASKVNVGDIIVADDNFGCGSSREHAPVAIKASGVSVVIARSFARIFYRNAFNTGLMIMECDINPEEIGNGDILEVNVETGDVKDVTTGKSYKAGAIPAFMQELVNAGGLIEYVRKHDAK